MKLIIYILFFLVTIAYVTSSNVGIAEVRLNVINNPPKIISIQTSEPLEGEHLKCDVVIKDEIVGVKTKYQWYKNNVLIEGQNRDVLDKITFKEGDIITCEAIPNDLVQDGKLESVSVTIKPRLLIPAITGAVVGFGKSQGFLNTFLFLLLMALVIFSVAHFSRKK